MEHPLQHPLILEKLRRAARWGRDERGAYAEVRLTREELARLSGLELLEGYAAGYECRRAARRPRSLREFLEGGEYVGTDAAVLRIPASDLVSAGALSRRVVGGGVCWVLGGEVLDPLRSADLYASSPDTVRTLLRAAGLEGVCERYRCEVLRRTGRLLEGCLLALRVGGAELCLREEDGMFVARRFYPVRDPLAWGSVELEAVRSGPEEALESLDRAELVVDEVVHGVLPRITELVDRSALEEVSVAGWAYEVERRGRRLGVVFQVWARPAYLEIVVRRDWGEPPVTEVTVESRWRGRLPERAVPPREALESLLPPGFWVERACPTEIEIVYRASLPGVVLPRGLARLYRDAASAEALLRRALEAGLERSPQLREAARLLGWGGEERDAALLRLAALALGFPERVPREARLLLAMHAALAGYGPELRRAFDDPHAALLELVCRGVLRAAVVGGGPTVLFGGRDVREVVPGLSPRLEAVLWRVLSLALPREELEELGEGLRRRLRSAGG